MKLLFLYLGLIALLFIGWSDLVYSKDSQEDEKIIQSIKSFRKERDHFFKTTTNSPLEEFDRRQFKGLKYFPIDLRYRFEGTIERYIININLKNA